MKSLIFFAFLSPLLLSSCNYYMRPLDKEVKISQPSSKPTQDPQPAPAPQNPTPPGNSQPDTNVASLSPTYESLLVGLFELKCNKCHSPGGKASDYDFSTYTDMMALKGDIFDFTNPDNSPIMISVLKTSGRGMMPPASSKIPRVTPEEASVLKNWIALGAPEK